MCDLFSCKTIALLPPWFCDSERTDVSPVLHLPNIFAVTIGINGYPSNSLYFQPLKGAVDDVDQIVSRTYETSKLPRA